MISSKHGIYMASTSCIFIYHDIHTSLTFFLNSASWHWGQQFQRQHCRCPGSRRDVDLESLHCVLTGQKNDGRMVLNCSVSVCRTVFWEQACQQCQASTAVSAVSTMLFKDCVGSPPTAMSWTIGFLKAQEKHAKRAMSHAWACHHIRVKLWKNQGCNVFNWRQWKTPKLPRQ